MRLVHLLVPSDELDTVTGVLDEEEIDYVVTEERSREGAEIVEFPQPVGAVETVLEALRDAGIDDGSYTVVANAETANDSANGAVQDTLEQPEYEELTLRSVSAEFTGLGLLGGEREVGVVVSRPAVEGCPDLAAAVGRRLRRRTGADVAVTVEFLERTEFHAGGAAG